MDADAQHEDRKTLLQIQNRQRPDQLIYLVWDKANNTFETEGLKELFNVKEIRIESEDLMQSLERYGHVLSFLFETMSTANELHLPYGYQSQFEFGGEKYSLRDAGDYRVLKQLDEQGPEETLAGEFYL